VTYHWLKTDPVYWDAINCGEKTFEVRRDDRGFQKGDMLKLVRTEPRHLQTLVPVDIATALDQKVISKRIRYILTGGQFGIGKGYVVMGLENE
jgi:hypothetical protein